MVLESVYLGIGMSLVLSGCVEILTFACNKMGFAVLAIIVLFWRRKKRKVKRIQLAHINTNRINKKGTGKKKKKA